MMTSEEADKLEKTLRKLYYYVERKGSELQEELHDDQYPDALGNFPPQQVEEDPLKREIMEAIMCLRIHYL